MKNIKKSSLIIFGYSEMLTLGLVVNSKLDKVKEFNISEDSNEEGKCDWSCNKIIKFLSNQLHTPS